MAIPIKRVSAVPLRTSLIITDEKGATQLTWPWLKHLQATNVAVNKAPQIQEDIPASMTSPGNFGDLVIDKATKTLYVCVAQDSWLKAVLVPF